MHDSTKNFADFLKEREPLTYAACHPRRITPPGGYTNPKHYTIVLRSQLMAAAMPEMNMLPHLSGIMNCFKHLELGVPTYFVRSEFAQAVAQTKPPEDFKFGELKWPMDALLFVLPNEFSRAYFGHDVPFISVVRAKAGVYPECVKLPNMEAPALPYKGVSNACDRFVCVFPVFSDHQPPVDYSATYNMDHSVGEVSSFEFQDATYYEEKLFDLQLPGSTDLPTGQAETDFRNKVFSFAVKLMLAVTARPNVIQTGTQTRKASVKKGVERDALWSPNTIGWEYRAERKDVQVAPGGHHASPRMHWRVGHMRNQAFGEQRSQRKLIWIEPVLVGGSDES